MIAIGGVGGSGTRVVADVLIKSGIYMGDELNESLDNLVFTRLFKNPEWYKNSSELSINKRLKVFKNYMEFHKLSIIDFIEIYNASKQNPLFKSEKAFYIQLLKMLFKKREKHSIWGWKEPNTQIYMNIILNSFKEAKYIHVIRHGLDMAYSNNKQQLLNWGWKYNISIDGNESESELSVKQLNYWIASTNDNIENSKKYKERFCLLNYNELYKNPKSEIDKLLEFIGISVSENVKNQLYLIPKENGSNNRYKNKDLNIFSNQSLEFVREMGFEI